MSINIKLLSTLLLSLFISSCLAEKESANTVAPETKTSETNQQSTIWQATEQGVTFSLQQIPPDKVDAFYLGRGFTLDQIKPYTKTCVYTGILRNDSAPDKIHFLRKSWSITSNKKTQHPKENAEWLSQFKLLKVKPSALIAFRFAQIPEEQEYETGGDWNRGMLSVNLPVPTKDKVSQFDITIYWDIKGKPYELTLREVKCVAS
jgi:hypothetical protein